MAFTIRYQPLCRLAILHHYFLNEGTTDFEDLPAVNQARRLRAYELADFMTMRADEPTLALLKGQRMRWKITAQGGQLFVQVDEDNRPIQPLDDTMILRFGFFLQDPLFWNYSSLRLRPSFHPLPEKNSTNRLFYFSNRSAYAGRTAPVLPHLHLSRPGFAAGSDYQMGDRVLQGGNPFEAQQDISNASLPLNADSGWLALSPDQPYVNAADEVRFHSPSFEYVFTEPNIEATIEVRDAMGRIVLTDDKAKSFDDHRTYRVDLKGFAPGFYQLEVNDKGGSPYTESYDFFHHPEWFGTNLWGVLEIGLPGLLNDGSDDPADEGKLLSPSYTVRIRNRSTQWRFRSANDQTILGDVSGVEQPLPLTQVGTINSVQLNSSPLPRPNPSMIIPVTDEERIYSDVFVDEELYN